ncbi:Rrf2 family transcriptional regulator [Moraxella osloensis]|uniref:HTH-type transcriptional regulator iscR n=1 Tax=Faucicola osloensis TaxID=34062 RepID=A0A378Q9C8_FAUOS|nr:Rrf2 family transcriptional regulator [Moraxella osloensis]OBX57321.1 Rrf2 family transcriptional regulator [Moraxella osloensis]QPT41860.1 Rrf2 family transcriptional regulator [Moraxella osloensis]STY97453.1 HTH-type transcriptional regulator iscR [Moraxella osloensis]
MRLTTRGRYAVTALLDLALQEQKHELAVSLSDIAKRQEISISYLEQLFSKLRKKGLVVSTRGASGGYHIAKPINEISIMTIISAVDESVDARACEGKGNCQDGAMCLTHDLWNGLSEQIENYLSTVTLDTLINRQIIREISERQILMVEDMQHKDQSAVNPMTDAPVLQRAKHSTTKVSNISNNHSLADNSKTLKQNSGENLLA